MKPVRVSRGRANRYRNGTSILRADDARLLKAKLDALGLPCHRAYMQTAHWHRVRREYEASALPRTCIVCGSPRTQLHHRSYARLGRELLLDLLPFCNRHHTLVHRLRKYRLSCPHSAVAEILSWNPKTSWPWAQVADNPLYRIDGMSLTAEAMAYALLKPWNLTGTRWVPSCRRDLILMGRRLGPLATSLQHARLVSPSPAIMATKYRSMTGGQARDYCRILRGGTG